MKCESIYKLIKKEIDSFPIYKIGYNEFSLVPMEFKQEDWFTAIKSISFHLTNNHCFEDVSSNTLIKVTEKVKKFLIKKFNRVISYTETWNVEDNRIEFEITYRRKKNRLSL